MTSKQINGTKSELLAEYYLIRHGYNVSKPINDFSEYDFVIEDEYGKLFKVGSCVTSHIRGNNRRTNKKYTEKSFDYGLFICAEYNKAYLIPIECIVGKRSITFYPNGKNNKTNTRYKDFETYIDTIM